MLLDKAPDFPPDLPELLQLVNAANTATIASVDFNIFFHFCLFLNSVCSYSEGGNKTLSMTWTMPLPALILASILAPPIMGSLSITSTFT